MVRRNKLHWPEGETRIWKPIQALLETISRRLGIERDLIAVTSANQKGPKVRAGFESGMLDSVCLTVSSHRLTRVLYSTLRTIPRVMLF